MVNEPGARQWGAFVRSAPSPLGDFNLCPFPMDCFPEPVRQYAETLALNLEVAPELVAHGVLGAAAAASQGGLVVEVFGDYEEPLNLFSLACLPPGERKSPVMNACKAPIEQWEKMERARIGEARREAQRHNGIFEQLIKNKKGGLKQADTEVDVGGVLAEIKALENQLQPVPAWPRLLGDDVTPEALAILLAEQNERIAVLEAEAGLFDVLGGRYQNGKPNLDLVLKSYSGESTRTDRVGRESIILTKPLLTLCLSVQPSVLPEIGKKKEFGGRGLISRFLFFWPPSKAGTRDCMPPLMPDELKESYAETITDIINLSSQDDGSVVRVPRRLRLSEDAYHAWRNCRLNIEGMMAAGGELEGLKDWANKHAGRVARFAGLLHILGDRSLGSLVITTETMARAVRLGEAMIPRARRAYRELGIDKRQDCTARILKWIQKMGCACFEYRDCFEAMPGPFKKAETFKAALSILCARGYLIQAPQERSSGPGRPKEPGYWVHPCVNDKKA